MCVCAATHKLKDFFFFLIQSEYGDIYKVTLTTDEDTVTEIQVGSGIAIGNQIEI